MPTPWEQYQTPTTPQSEASADGPWSVYSQDQPSSPASSTPEEKRPSTKKRIAEGLLSAADMVMSFPGMVGGLAAETTGRIIAADPTGLIAPSLGMTVERAQENGRLVSEFLGSPLSKIRKLGTAVLNQGDTSSIPETNDVTELMGKVGQVIGKAGKGVEDLTGGIIDQKSVEYLSNAGMTLAGTGIVKAGVKALRPKAEALPKPVPPPEAPPGIMDSPVIESSREAPATTAPEVAKYEQLATERQSTTGDKLRNTEQQAYDLMQQGASKAKVEAMRKQNPALGETLDRMMERRQQAIDSMSRTLQGEVLGPEQFPTPKGKVERLAPETFENPMSDIPKTMEALSAENVQQGLDKKYTGFSPKERGSVSPGFLLALGGTAVGVITSADDPISGGLIGLAAGALAAKGIGAVKKIAPAEMAKLGDEFWKPDFNTILNPRYLERALIWTRSAATADTTMLWQHTKNGGKAGVTPEMDMKFRNYSEGSVKSLTPQEKVLYDKYVSPLREKMAEELNKIQDPAERQIIGQEIETRVAKSHRAWWDAMANGIDNPGPMGFQRTASATKSRSVFALPDGTTITVKAKEGGGYDVTAWKDNQPTFLGVSRTRIEKGAEFMGMKIESAKQARIEADTPIRYVSSDIATHSIKLAELMKYNRERELLTGLMKSPSGREMFVDATKGQPGPDMVPVPGGEFIPQLRNVYMPKEYAEVLGDFLIRNKESGGLLEGATNIITRAMMLNPIPHVGNELAHWFDSRGIGGLISPTGLSGASKGLYGLAKTLPDAIRSVLLQDKFQIELQKSGGMLLYPSVRNQKAWTDIIQIGLGDAVKSKDFMSMAKALGTSPVALAKRISDNSAATMWAIRDIMYTQLVKEQVLMGKSIAEAAGDVGKHMPEYMLPSRVGFEGTAGRAVSKALNSKLLVFSRYHYGMVKAVVEVGKELTSGRVPTMVTGLDRAAALMAGMVVVFPLLDEVIQATFGDNNIHQRRTGPYHIFDTAGKIMDGEKDISALVTSLLTPNPATAGVFELLNNKYGFSGQPIIYPNTSPTTKAVDAARYVGSKLAPVQVGSAIQEGRMTTEEYAYRQLDIIAMDPNKKARQKKYRDLMNSRGQAHEKKLKEVYGY